MFGVACPKILANLEIGVGPEVSEILGNLNRAEVRAEQMKHDGDQPACNPWSVGPTENLLNPDLLMRRPVAGVGEANPMTARDCEGVGNLLVEPAIF
jgi:hypothetical protein